MHKETPLTDLDHVDILQDGLLKMWHIYCSDCGKTYEGGGNSVDVAMDLFEKGWRRQLHGNAYCQNCVSKNMTINT